MFAASPIFNGKCNNRYLQWRKMRILISHRSSSSTDKRASLRLAVLRVILVTEHQSAMHVEIVVAEKGEKVERNRRSGHIDPGLGGTSVFGQRKLNRIRWVAVGCRPAIVNAKVEEVTIVRHLDFEGNQCAKVNSCPVCKVTEAAIGNVKVKHGLQVGFVLGTLDGRSLNYLRLGNRFPSPLGQVHPSIVLTCQFRLCPRSHTVYQTVPPIRWSRI